MRVTTDASPGWLGHEDARGLPSVTPWQEALLTHLEKLTAAVEGVQGSLAALHDRLDTLERAWKARGSL